MSSCTFEGSGILRDLRSPVGIGLPVIGLDVARPDLEGLWAIWDTGATGCAITGAVASKLGAYPINQVPIGGVHGVEYCNQYLVSIFLPNKLFLPEVYVSELSDAAGCDVLIGMDIIGLGDFYVTSMGGKTTFTFRIPQLQRMDFTKCSPHLNAPCLCGSKKAYKNCCNKLVRKITK